MFLAAILGKKYLTYAENFQLKNVVRGAVLGVQSLPWVASRGTEVQDFGKMVNAAKGEKEIEKYRKRRGTECSEANVVSTPPKCLTFYYTTNRTHLSILFSKKKKKKKKKSLA